MDKKKALTNAQRQARYRKNNWRRLNTVISPDASLYLERLASHYAVTKRKMLENLLEAEKKRVIEKTSIAEFYGEENSATND